MKLAVIMPPINPMPPVVGAGLERLIDTFARENERAGDPIEITIFSRVDSRSAELAKEFRHTEFVYLNTTRSEPSSNRLERLLHCRKSGENVRFDYLRELKKAFRGREFDEILLANCFEFAKHIAKFTKKQPILYARGLFGEKSFTKEIHYIKRFIFSSEFLKNAAVRAGVPAERSSVVRDSVDLAMFDPVRFKEIRTEKRAKYGLSDDDILLVFVGRLVPDKGVIELVKAVAGSTWNRSKLSLLLVGSAQLGEDVRDEYREMLESAAPEGKIIFIGSVKPTSTARFLARADIAVVPSIWDEPAGLPVLEPMAIGLPIIASDSGALSEYAAGLGEGCTIVKRGLGYVNSLSKAIDATAARLDEPGWREKVAAESRKAAEKFSSTVYYKLFSSEISK